MRSICVIGILIVAVFCAALGDVVSFPDPGLDAVIRDVIANPQDSPKEVAGVTSPTVIQRFIRPLRNLFLPLRSSIRGQDLSLRPFGSSVIRVKGGAHAV